MPYTDDDETKLVKVAGGAATVVAEAVGASADAAGVMVVAVLTAAGAGHESTELEDVGNESCEFDKLEYTETPSSGGNILLAKIDIPDNGLIRSRGGAS